jgi:hypothetical protein
MSPNVEVSLQITNHSALPALVSVKLLSKVISVSFPSPDDEEDGEGTVSEASKPHGASTNLYSWWLLAVSGPWFRPWSGTGFGNCGKVGKRKDIQGQNRVLL